MPSRVCQNMLPNKLAPVWIGITSMRVPALKRWKNRNGKSFAVSYKPFQVSVFVCAFNNSCTLHDVICGNTVRGNQVIPSKMIDSGFVSNAFSRIFLQSFGLLIAVCSIIVLSAASHFCLKSLDHPHWAHHPHMHSRHQHNSQWPSRRLHPKLWKPRTCQYLKMWHQMAPAVDETVKDLSQFQRKRNIYIYIYI